MLNMCGAAGAYVLKSVPSLYRKPFEHETYSLRTSLEFVGIMTSIACKVTFNNETRRVMLDNAGSTTFHKLQQLVNELFNKNCHPHTPYCILTTKATKSLCPLTRKWPMQFDS